MRKVIRSAAAVTGGCVVFGSAMLLSNGQPAAQAAVAAPVHAVRSGVLRLRYNPGGVQLTCTRAELGRYGLVFGDGPGVFAVRCVADGPRLFVWDAS